VLIDATVIRLLIVPSLMFVFDRANWWTPRWLDGAFPHPEPDSPAVTVAPASQASAAVTDLAA
jgi:RND superfamily putative drug exporter